MERVSPVLTVLFLGILYADTAFGSESAEEIIRHGEKQLRGKSTQSIMVMDIFRPDFTRSLKIRTWTLGDKRTMVEILLPLKEEGVSSLRTVDKMWNYLPKTDQVVRVPTSMMLQSWMGSDFTNDDLMKASSIIRDYTHRILKREKLLGQRTIKIECRPKPGAPVVWGKIFYWAREKDRLPIKQAFFDESGILIRTLTFSKFIEMDGRVIPTVIQVDKADNPSEKTIVQYKKILYDRKIGADFFDHEQIRHIAQRGRDLSGGWFLSPMVAHRAPPKKSKSRILLAKRFTRD